MTHTQTSHAIIRESEYLGLLSDASVACGSWVRAIQGNPMLLDHPGALAKVAEASHALETFLDDHGAGQNQTFVTFRELVASLRGLSRVKSKLLHLRFRLPRYPTVSGTGDLSERLDDAARKLNGFLLALGKRLSDEADQLQLPWGQPLTEALGPYSRSRQLPRNLDIDVNVDEKEHIAEIGGRLIAILDASRGLGLDRVRSGADLADYASQYASEDRCRWYESAAHNIQSMYDTHVAGTGLESAHPWLVQVRGHASIVYHLLEMATDLVHFYERHESDLRHEPSKAAISAVVSRDEILEVAINTCLRQAYLFVEGTSGLVDRILQAFVSRRDEVFTLPDGVTLHARPLALIVQVARHYGTPMEIEIEGDRCSANSLMGLIMLAGRHPKARVLSISGDSRALGDLSGLFRAGLGENGSVIPDELEYLRLGSG